MANTGNPIDWDEPPFDPASDRVLNAARDLDPKDQSVRAQRLRAAARIVVERREAYRKANG
jgi:hypothetical protein